MTIIWATFVRQSLEIRAAFPWHFFIGRSLSGVYAALFAYFILQFGFAGEVTEDFRAAVGSSDFYTSAILGAALNVMAVSCLMNVGRTLMNELREGTLPALMLAPGHLPAYFFASWMQQWLRCLLEVAPTLLVGALLGASLLQVSEIDYVLLCLVAMTSLFCMGVLLAWVMIWARDTYLTQNTLFAVLVLVCGVMCPRELLPEPMQWLAQFIPFSHLLDLFRNTVMHQQSWLAQLDVLAWLTGTSISYLLAALLAFRLLARQLNERTFA
ncbi:ABC transporter permease [Salinibius halmophilus]|uniref:ABC transporter permease n=1 Tax=Salinibius halmophilus TaxID=1853216 RepID=UPI000E673DCC|nr:ABC transporter permease [Salinibius halmophilus]